MIFIYKDLTLDSYLLRLNTWFTVFHFSPPALVLGQVNIHITHTLPTWSLEFLTSRDLLHFSRATCSMIRYRTQITTRNFASKIINWMFTFVLKPAIALAQSPRYFHCMCILTSKLWTNWSPFLSTSSFLFSLPALSRLVFLLHQVNLFSSNFKSVVPYFFHFIYLKKKIHLERNNFMSMPEQLSLAGEKS